MYSVMSHKFAYFPIQIKLYVLMLLFSLPLMVEAVNSGDTTSVVTKQMGDSLYVKGEYQEAASVYESLIEDKGHSSQLYYNIGNCYYKLGNVYKSILNYERALKLSPGDSDIRENLALARGKTVDKVTPPSEMFFVTWWRNITMMMSVDSWAVFALVCFIISLVGVLAYILLSNITIRKIGVYMALIFVVITIISNLAAMSLRSQTLERLYAIVSVPVRTVKSSPSESSTDLFVIHEGAKVEILDNSFSGWCEIKLEEGKIGWIPTDLIEII